MLAVLGDTEQHQAASGALRDLVREHRSSSQAWFVPDEAALDERLRALRAAPRRGLTRAPAQIPRHARER